MNENVLKQYPEAKILEEIATRDARGGSAPRVEGRTAHASGGNSTPETGATSCNTAPSTCIGDEHTRILRTGIDSLYLSYHGELLDESSVRLEELKSLAQSKDPEYQKLAQYQSEGHLFEVRDRGRFPFSYTLADRTYRIDLSGSGARSTPMAYVQLASEALTLFGPESLLGTLTKIVEGLGVLDGEPTVSRADLCVDFVTDFDLSKVIEEQWVTRARSFSRHHVKRRFSGLTIGQGGNLSARLYDKTLEIQSSGKQFFEAVWTANGWDGNQKVWRLEFQFRRDVLRQLGVKTVSDLLSRLQGLWRYATEDWLRLTEPDPHDNTPSRWPLHPLWAVMQAANWGVESTCVRSHAETERPPSDRYLFVQGLSGITSFMAREGIDDPYEGIAAYWRAARDYHNSFEAYSGLTFEAYIEQKVAIKARRYNTMLNQPDPGEPHPADAAVAREYRKRRDGE